MFGDLLFPELTRNEDESNMVDDSHFSVAGRRAVTMPELLVVFGTIALMLAALIPGIAEVRERMRRVQCANNERQWGIALQMYRDENLDYLPTEGTYTDLNKPYTWFNVLPPYLNLQPYKEVEKTEKKITEFPQLHVWICPAKSLTTAYKSSSGENQFHYGMNQVLDGVGAKVPSVDTPGFRDMGEDPLPGKRFTHHPNTVFLFDIAPNSPAGTPRDVATEYYRWFDGTRVGRFHGDYANFLCLDGVVRNAKTSEWITDNDMRHGKIIWDNPKLYWGYPVPK